MNINCAIKSCRNKIQLTNKEQDQYNFFIKSGFIISKLCNYHSVLTKHTWKLADDWLKENNLSCGSGIDSYSTVLKLSLGSFPTGFKFSSTLHSKALDAIEEIRKEAKRLTEKELKRS